MISDALDLNGQPQFELRGANLTDMSAVQTLPEVWIYCNAKISMEKNIEIPQTSINILS